MAKSGTKRMVRVRSAEARALDRRYVEGYRKKPEDTVWAKAAAKLIARVLSSRRSER